MARLSPGRFLLIWTSAAAGIALLAHLAGLVFRRYSAIGFLAELLLAGLQAVLLAVHRRRVRWWATATVLGWLGGVLLWDLAGNQVVDWAHSLGSDSIVMWVLVPFDAVTTALAQGAAQALALWGRRWGTETFQWLAGLSLAHLLAGAPGLILSQIPDPQSTAVPLLHIASLLLRAAIAAAGTAWLLDRLVFREAA